METITKVEQIDSKLLEIAQAAGESDDAARRVFSSFKMDFSTSVPPDPFSDEYTECQMQLYQRIAGRDYISSNEVSTFNVKAAVLRPFPFNSGSTVTTGAHLSALGFLISHIRLRPGASILEFGPGWGNTTITLALLGFQVTAVDVEQNFCDLIHDRAKANNVSVEVINDEFFLCERMSNQFDAVLFYECFHHCADHMRLLRGLHQVVKPGGRVYLGCEPITDDFPLPWGLRLDGESLWAIRQNGWMELGFNIAYFKAALARTGWIARYHLSKDVGFGNVWELERPLQEAVFIPASDPRIRSMTGHLENECIVSNGSNAHSYILYGPYVTLSQGKWMARIHLNANKEHSGQVVMDVCHSVDNKVFAARSFSLNDSSDRKIELSFELHSACADVEVRLLCNMDVVISIFAIELCPIVG